MLLYPSVVVPATAITAGNALIDSTTANAFAAPIVSGSPFDFGPYRDGRSYLELYASGVLVGKALISKSKSAGETLDSELVTNGDFASDSGWSKGPNTTISDGVCNIGSAGYIHQNLTTGGYVGAAGKLLKISGDVIKSGGTNLVHSVFYLVPTFLWPGTPADIVLIGATGTFSKYATSTGTSTYTHVSSMTLIGTLDNYSIKQVLTPAATAALLESAPGVRGWIYKSATAFKNAALTMKIIQMKRYPNPRKINGVSTHHA